MVFPLSCGVCTAFDAKHWTAGKTMARNQPLAEVDVTERENRVLVHYESTILRHRFYLSHRESSRLRTIGSRRRFNLPGPSTHFGRERAKQSAEYFTKRKNTGKNVRMRNAYSNGLVRHFYSIGSVTGRNFSRATLALITPAASKRGGRERERARDRFDEGKISFAILAF